MMSSNISTETGPKRKRIMIIIDDESIIDEAVKCNDVLLLKQNVFSFNGNNSERDNKESKIQSSHTNKSKNSCLICVVCGSSAHGCNFGAIVCESCKSFFRRNARKNPINFPCNNNGDCQITLDTRRNCAACRLAKCFNKGMKHDRLSTDEQKALKRRQREELVSNSIDKINEEEFQLASSTCSDDLFSSIDTNILFADFLLSQPQQTLLTSEDIQRVETISLFYQKRIEFADREGLPWNPSTQTKNFLQFLNSQSVSVMRLLAFFKQIPEFNQLNVDDKVTLIKYNLPTVHGLNSALQYNTETNQIIENDSDTPMNTQYFRVLHGYQICMKIQKVFSEFVYIVKYDRKIIELTILILILTKGFSIITDHDEQILKDNKSVYRAQNYYVELLWKYMETIHGYTKAIHLFSQLIIHAISWQTIQGQIRDDVLRTLSPEDITQLLPIIKSIMHI